MPSFDEKERGSACSMDRQPSNSCVNAGISPFATVRVAPVGAQRSNPPNNRVQARQNLPHIIGNQWVNVGAVGRQAKRLLHSIVEALHILLCRERLPELDKN